MFFFLCRLALIFPHLFILLNAPFGCLPTHHQDFSGAPSEDWNDLIGSACSPFLSLSLYPCFLPSPLPPSLSLCATCVLNIFNEGVIFLKTLYVLCMPKRSDLEARTAKSKCHGTSSLCSFPHTDSLQRTNHPCPTLQ